LLGLQAAVCHAEPKRDRHRVKMDGTRDVGTKFVRNKT
jgi:hypothetical protein